MRPPRQKTLSSHDRELVSASVEPWRIDRDQWKARALAAEAALEATEVERDEAESFANEGWMWLDEALSALGVGTVFDIKAAGEKRMAAEARIVQLETALREYAPPLRVDAWHAEECWTNDEDWFYERWLETADDCSPDTPYDERRAVFNAWWAIQPEPTDAEMCAEGCPYPRMRALLTQADQTGDTT